MMDFKSDRLLVGYNDGDSAGSSITNSYAMGNVTGEDSYVGGLVGFNYGCTVTNSYAIGSVSGTSYVSNYVGGLVGFNSRYSDITNSYAAGKVTGCDYVAGLVGNNHDSHITNSYATGSVTGSSYVGGMVGDNEADGSITNSYATGSVTGNKYHVGGLVGYSYYGTITNSFWDTTTSGQTTSAGGTGKTSAEMMHLSTFSSWNTATPNTIADIGGSGAVWRIYEGHTAPLLTCFLTPLTLADAPDVTTTYNGKSQSAHSTTISKPLLLGSAATGTNAGFYNGYYSTQQGYDITGGNLIINPKDIEVVTLKASKIYDGTTMLGAGTVTIDTGVTVNGITESLNYSGATAYSKNVVDNGINYINAITLLDGTGLAANYALPTLNHSNAPVTIMPKALTISGLSVPPSKVYDGTTTAVVSGTSTLVSESVGTGNTSDGKSYSSDSVSLSGAAVGTYNSKDVATASTVAYSGLSLTGGQAGNYTLSTQSPVSAKIIPKTVTTLSASKTYDGTTTLGAGTVTVGTGVTVNGITELLGYSGATASSKNVVDNTSNYIKAITLLDGTGGGLAANYALPTLNHSNAPVTITPKALTMSGLSVATSKVYDGTTKAVVTGTKALEVAEAAGQGNATDGKSYTGDTVSITGTAVGTYNSKDVANASTVTYSGLSLTGSQSGNYMLTIQNPTSAIITPKALTMSGLSVAAKVYDGTTAAVVSGTSTLAAAEAVGTGNATDGKSYTGDTVSIIGTVIGTYNSKDVATTSTATYSGLSLTGSQAGNYTLTIQSPAIAKITPKALTMSGLSVASKVYDGTTKAVVTDAKTLATAETAGQGTASDGKSYIGDTVSITGTAVGTYNSKDVATATKVTYSGLSLTGSQAGNYTLTMQSPTSATISPKALSMSGLTVAASKVYDGTTKAVVTGTKTLASAEAVGTGTATDGKRYTSDTVSLIGTAVGTYNSKDVATASTVTYSGLSLTGSQAANYTLTIQSPASATITPKALTMSGLSVAASKVYDGTTNAVVTGTQKLAAGETAGTGTTADGKSYTGDTVSLIGTAVGTYNSKDVATASKVTFSGLSLTGSQAGNYTLTIQSTASAKITKKTVTLSATKTYDGTTTLGAGTVTIGTGVTLNGITELLGYSGATANSKNIADNATNYIKTITLLNGTGGGLAANYALPTLNHVNAPVTIH